MGIDPDARQEADASPSDDASPNDGGGTIDVATDANEKDASPSDAEVQCRDAGDCVGLARSACEKGICAAGQCALVSRDGESCGLDGTCRSYACIGSTTTLALSGDTSCMRASDGLVWCWGNDSSGQLGDRGTNARSTPYLVPRIGDDLASANTVSVGFAHTCATLTDGKVVCWGSNTYAQSSGDDAGASGSIAPTVVAAAPSSKAVTAGWGHTCVLGSDTADVWCWGDNSVGEIGVNSREAVILTPTRISLLAGVTTLSGAWQTECAVYGGGLLCWGDDTWGQLGDTWTNSFAPYPITIPDLGNLDDGGSEIAEDVTTGWGNVCAILAGTGHVQCWGNDRAGQIGDGKLHAFGDGGDGDMAEPSPVYVEDPDDTNVLTLASAIAFGGSHACAFAQSYPGPICWGQQVTNELGASSAGFYAQPIHDVAANGASCIALGDAHACILRSEVDGFDISCTGHGQRGQLGDGLSIDEHVGALARVHFPDPPGGVAALRASE